MNAISPLGSGAQLGHALAGHLPSAQVGLLLWPGCLHKGTLDQQVHACPRLQVFSQFPDALRMVAKALAVQQPPIGCVSLLAGGSSSARSNAVSQFRDVDSVRVFLLSLNAGAQGLTLVRGGCASLLGFVSGTERAPVRIQDQGTSVCLELDITESFATAGGLGVHSLSQETASSWLVECAASSPAAAVIVGACKCISSMQGCACASLVPSHGRVCFDPSMSADCHSWLHGCSVLQPARCGCLNLLWTLRWSSRPLLGSTASAKCGPWWPTGCSWMVP